MFWKGKRVLVTGGAGFIGSHLTEKLLHKGATVTILTRSRETIARHLPHVSQDIRVVLGDCMDPESARKACKGQEIVLNLAARVGGIEYNRTHQGTMLADNLQIVTTMLKAAQKANVGKFLVVSSACVYPHEAKIPTPESEGFVSEPEPTNLGYGWAKRMAEILGRLYAQEFGLSVTIVRPYNCYGPRDHFDSTNGHVIPSLITRVLGGENPVHVWGSGKQTRAFLYVEDLAEGMMASVERAPNADPINLGTNEEITIGDLVRKIIAVSGVKTKVVFDTAKPDGSPRRNSDNRKAAAVLGFQAKTSLETGLEKTVLWYKQHILSKEKIRI